MPRLTNSLPAYRHHKARGLAVVTLSGKDFYLGPYGSKASRLEYDRLVSEWLQNGRRLVGCNSSDISVVELCNAFRKYADTYYVKNGEMTREAFMFRELIRLIVPLYGRTLAVEFGPVALKTIRLKLVESGLCRTHINKQIQRIRRMFRWAVAEEMIPATVCQGLDAVTGLRKGRSDARESASVRPVGDTVIDAILPHLTGIVADMVRFQRHTGCRPAEVRILCPCDVDTSGDVWVYIPESHKTEHHGRERVIFIGPKAQDVLRPYLLRDKSAYCFSPVESVRKRRESAHAQRTTPVNQGNRPGTNRKKGPKRTAGECYTKDSYRRAIERACDVAFLPPEPLSQLEGETKKARLERLTPKQIEQLKAWQKEHRWSPNQLRHTAATAIRQRYGLEAAQVTLGHANADVTQVYAERDQAKAREIMREVG